MKRKRVLSGLGALAFACLSAGVLAATGRKPPPTVSAAAPNTTREFTIAGFVEYYPFTETSHAEQTRGLAASGLNWIDLPLTYSNPGTTTANLNADTFDWDAFNTLSGELGVYFSMTTNNNSYSGAEIAKAVARAGDLDRCIAYYVKDEPSSAQIPAVADAFKQYRQADPGRFPYVNLFPNYAGASNLGGSYEDYARQWVAAAGADNLEYLYFDHYPFTQNAGSVRASYFSDVETIRKVAYENGKLKTGGYTQMGTWNGMREPTPDEARWSMNSLLAYGMKSISHFCWVAPAYVQPPAGEGMGNHVLTSTGAETARYAPMQRLNWQTRQLGPVLMSIDTAHAYHTGSAPSGTEALPKNFLLQPANAGDNLIFSLCYGKDGGLYLMLFSKELSGSKSYTVNADTSTGMTGLTWYKPDSFDVLPTPSAGLELPAPQEVPVPFSDGSFTVELQAGEMRLYRIEGGAEIKEDLKAPTISHKSGAYVGRQSVTMSAPDAGTEIYYTTDGSYPTYRSARYTAPISIGADGQTSFHTVRAIAIRGAEITEPAVSELIIADASVNAAQGKAAYFQTANGVPIGTETFNGSGTAGSVTDGAFDPFNAYGSADGKPGFAVVDFGADYPIGKVTVKAWHDWAFAQVVIQLSADASFPNDSRTYTVFNNDTAGAAGAGAGTDSPYIENDSGHTYTFAPVTARYIRFHNVSAQNETRKSVWEEIRAYSVYTAGDSLSAAPSSNWKITGGGTWANSGGAIAQTAGYNTANWDRSYTYTARTYKNFILDGTFTFNVSDPAAWGYAGFGLFKKTVDSVQGNADSGIYAAVEPRGRALLWNGEREIGPDDANIAGFPLGAPFNLRVVSYGGLISIAVNNRPVLTARPAALAGRGAGYISIHGGLIPVSVSDIRIVDLDGEAGFPVTAEAIRGVEETRAAVERLTGAAAMLAALPSAVSATDTAGNTRLLAVTWSAEGYDGAAGGEWARLTGRFTSLPAGLMNALNIVPYADVFVRPRVDKSDLEALVAFGRSLPSENFTMQSWTQMLIKLNAAESLLADPFLVQSDIGVGVWQLYDEIYLNLVSTVDRTALLEGIVDAESIDTARYFAAGAADFTRKLGVAREVAEDRFSTPESVSAALQSLNAAQNALTEKNLIEVTAPPAAKPVAPVKPAPSEKPDEPAPETPKKGCGNAASIVFASVLPIVLALKKRRP